MWGLLENRVAIVNVLNRRVVPPAFRKEPNGIFFINLNRGFVRGPPNSHAFSSISTLEFLF